jgi:hypothetical protein
MVLGQFFSCLLVINNFFRHPAKIPKGILMGSDYIFSGKRMVQPFYIFVFAVPLGGFNAS